MGIDEHEAPRLPIQIVAVEEQGLGGRHLHPSDVVQSQAGDGLPVEGIHVDAIDQLRDVGLHGPGDLILLQSDLFYTVEVAGQDVQNDAGGLDVLRQGFSTGRLDNFLSPSVRIAPRRSRPPVGRCRAGVPACAARGAGTVAGPTP